MVVEFPEGQHLGGDPNQLQHAEGRNDHKGPCAAQASHDFQGPQDRNPLEQRTAGDHDAVGGVGVQRHGQGLLSGDVLVIHDAAIIKSVKTLYP